MEGAKSSYNPWAQSGTPGPRELLRLRRRRILPPSGTATWCYETSKRVGGF